MAESVDALRSERSGRKPVEVQVLFCAQFNEVKLRVGEDAEPQEGVPPEAGKQACLPARLALSAERAGREAGGVLFCAHVLL